MLNLAVPEATSRQTRSALKDKFLGMAKMVEPIFERVNEEEDDN